MKILIAHPAPAIRLRWQEELEIRGAWVITTSNATTLTDRIRSHTPQAVVISERLEGWPALIDIARDGTHGSAAILLAQSTDGDLSFGRHSPDAIIVEAETSGGEIFMLAGDLDAHIRNRGNARSILRIGELELNGESRIARLGAAQVTNIPPRLFDTLWQLAKKATESPEPMSRQALINRIGKKAMALREIDVIMSRLRSKVPFLIPYLQAVSGKGYRLLPPSLVTPSPKRSSTGRGL